MSWIDLKARIAADGKVTVELVHDARTLIGAAPPEESDRAQRTAQTDVLAAIRRRLAQGDCLDCWIAWKRESSDPHDPFTPDGKGYCQFLHGVWADVWLNAADPLNRLTFEQRESVRLAFRLNSIVIAQQLIHHYLSIQEK